MKLTEEDIDRFLTTMEFAKTTQRSRGYVLRAFVKRLGDRDFDEDSVRDYARQTYNNPRTYNKFIRTVKSFAGWKKKRLPREDLRAYVRDCQILDLIRDIRPRRVVTVLERKELSDKELRTIFSSLEGVKFSGLWCLGWFGPRPGELMGLKLKDMNKKPDRYLSPSLAKELGPNDYCIKFLTEKTVVERALFMDKFTKRHLENFIRSGHGCKFLQTTCAKLRDNVGVSFTPRWFRSTFMTEMQRTLMKVGVPMAEVNFLVKAMSGHIVHSRDTMDIMYPGKEIMRAMTNLHFMKPLEKEKRSGLDDPDDRAIPGQMGGLTDEREKVKG